MLATLSIDGSSPAELEPYLREDFERFLHTIELARGHSGACLEIGANPYFTSVLLRELCDFELTFTNSFSDDAPARARQLVSYVNMSGSVSELEADYYCVNVETENQPFPDDSFDVVLFCEVIEHLVTDPFHALMEIHRVLKPGGTLIVSTPNVARAENVARLIAGENIYDPYSGHGRYGRHNREFTRHELFHFVQHCGFKVENHFTADVHENGVELYAAAEKLDELLAHRSPDLGQYLFLSATKSDGFEVNLRPRELYRSLPENQLGSWVNN